MTMPRINEVIGVKKSGVADGGPSVVGMGMSNCVVGMGMVGNAQARPVLSRELRSGLATVMEGHDGKQDRMNLGRTGAVYPIPHLHHLHHHLFWELGLGVVARSSRIFFFFFFFRIRTLP